METGRFIRTLMIQYDNPSTHIAREAMAHGRIHPSWFAAYGWLREFIEGGCAAHHLVFDGACRRMWEAKLLDEVMKWHQRSLPLCIYIDVSRREAYRRLLSRGRADDKPATIKNRLDYFPREVMPVVRYYQAAGRMIRVSGEFAPEGVWEQIDAALHKRLGKAWPLPSKRPKK